MTLLPTPVLRTETRASLLGAAPSAPVTADGAPGCCRAPVEVDASVPAGWADEVRVLARRRGAVILAHNYQRPEIQDIADHVGDSLGLSRIAAETDAAEIVFCGVHFMAETAKLLSPAKTVLIPDARAGCSLADTITADQVRAWKAQHPGAAVVAYVNTSAAVKAETDVCCTSSNAADVVRSIPAEQEVLFLPDRHLGAHVRRVTGRENIRVWEGQCHVHEGISAETLTAAIAADPEADVLVHPECACANAALGLTVSGVIPREKLRIVSTGGMLVAAQRTTVQRVIVATETGMLHQLRRANPGVEFSPAAEHAVCSYMKMITARALLECLRTGRDEVTVPEAVAAPARRSVQRMIEIGAPAVGGA